MSSQSKSQLGRVLAMLSAMIVVLCMFATRAAAQDQAPKWELFGGYSFFHPGADVHGQLPGALLPLSSRLEVNPRASASALPIISTAGWDSLSIPVRIGVAVKPGSPAELTTPLSPTSR